MDVSKHDNVSLLAPRSIFNHLLVGLFALTCIWLGTWQLGRLDQRRAYNARIQQQVSRPMEDFSRLMPSTAVRSEQINGLAYRRVRVQGAYDGNREVLLENRANAGQPGSHLLTPLLIDPSAALIVNRGWIPLGLAGPPVAKARPPAGDVTVTGILLPADPRTGFGPNDPPPGPTKRLSRVDLPRLAKQLPYQVYPLQLRLVSQSPPNPAPVPQPAPLPTLDEGPHFGYAIQWFIFAGLAVVTYVIAAYRRRSIGLERTSA